MAQSPQAQQPTAPKEKQYDKDTRFFKSDIAGLKVMVGDPDVSKGEVSPKYVRFTPYWCQVKGREGVVKIGYLATKNGSALKKLENDPNVKEIELAEYREATELHKDESGKIYAGIKARL